MGQLFYRDEADGQLDGDSKFVAARLIRVKGTNLITMSDDEGRFVIENVPKEEQTLEFIYHGYEVKTWPLNLKGEKDVDLGKISLYYDWDAGPAASREIVYLQNEKLNKDLREIIALATDKEQMGSFSEKDAIVSNTFVSYPADGYDAISGIQYNLEKAAKLVKERGLEGVSLYGS